MEQGRWLALGAGLVCAVLASCAPQPPFEEVTDPFGDASAGGAATLPGAVGGGAAAAGAPGATDTVTFANDGGLLERLPNTCKLENYQQFAGQPGGAARAGVTDRPVRVIAPNDIVTQEYNPQRVNFYVDGGGTIQRIICG
ncbi:MAG: I78 family peptidase inhibitor [Pseudomonadota bacterium]